MSILLLLSKNLDLYTYCKDENWMRNSILHSWYLEAILNLFYKSLFLCSKNDSLLFNFFLHYQIHNRNVKLQKEIVDFRTKSLLLNTFKFSTLVLSMIFV